MLPASKDDFPKCLYLDQNKWIDLARAHYCRPGGDAFKDALRILRASIESGKLIVPFSLINVVEAMIAKDASRRERLARFMVEMSCNHTILPEDSVSRWEIMNSVVRLVGKSATEAVRTIVVRRGMAHVLGLDLQFVGPAGPTEIIKTHLDSSEATIEFLMTASAKRERITQSLVGESTAVGIFERDRTYATTLGLEQRRRWEFDELFLGSGAYRPALEMSLRELGIACGDFLARLQSDSDAMQFLADIPNLDILLTLRLARDQDSVRRIERNDIRDLDWLSVTLPYSNCVVMENYWRHQVCICMTGLDVKYGTVMLTDLRQLPEHLRAMGCIS